VIELSNVTVRLGDRRALHDISLSFPSGGLIAVIGPNGAGKTTLLKAIAGLVPLRGRIALDGRDTAGMAPAERARKIAYLPQGNVVHWPISVRDAVAIGRTAHGASPSRLAPADRAAIERALATTDIAHLAHRPVTELSGGERARVMLARALAIEAPILLADEPTAALDPAHQLDVMALLARAAASGGTILAALHDLTLAARFADRTLVLSSGMIAADGPPGETLTPALLDSVFGIAALHLTHDGAPLVVPWSRREDMRR
jgi:iron complex transport system ATP-binding protein